MCKKLISILTVILLSIGAYAQPKLVKGNVVDDKGLAVIGASVVESGTTNGVVTDIDGNYSISVREGSTLTISSIGYKTETITVGAADLYNVILAEGYYRILPGPDTPGPCSRCPGRSDLRCSGFILIHTRPRTGNHQCQRRASLCN